MTTPTWLNKKLVLTLGMLMLGGYVEYTFLPFSFMVYFLIGLFAGTSALVGAALHASLTSGEPANRPQLGPHRDCE